MGSTFPPAAPQAAFPCKIEAALQAVNVPDAVAPASRNAQSLTPSWTPTPNLSTSPLRAPPLKRRRSQPSASASLLTSEPKLGIVPPRAERPRVEHTAPVLSTHIFPQLSQTGVGKQSCTPQLNLKSPPNTRCTSASAFPSSNCEYGTRRERFSQPSSDPIVIVDSPPPKPFLSLVPDVNSSSRRIKTPFSPPRHSSPRCTVPSDAAPIRRRSAPSPPSSIPVTTAHIPSFALSKRSIPVSNCQPSVALPHNPVLVEHRMHPSHNVIVVDPHVSSPSLPVTRRNTSVCADVPSKRHRTPINPSNSSTFSYRPISTASRSGAARINRPATLTQPLDNISVDADHFPLASHRRSTPVSHFRPRNVHTCTSTSFQRDRQHSDPVIFIDCSEPEPSPSSAPVSHRTALASRSNPSKRRPTALQPTSNSADFSYRPIPTTPSSDAAPVNRHPTLTLSSNAVSDTHLPPFASSRRSAPVSHFRPPVALPRSASPAKHRQQPAKPSKNSASILRRTTTSSSFGNAVSVATRRSVPPKPFSNVAGNHRRRRHSNSIGSNLNSRFQTTHVAPASIHPVPLTTVPNVSPVRPQQVAMLDFSSVIDAPPQNKYDPDRIQRTNNMRRVGNSGKQRHAFKARNKS